MNPQRAAARAEELADRLQRRLAEVAKERDIAALPPIVLAGALIVPAGLLQQLNVIDATDQPPEPEPDPARRAEIERLAMEAVMATERALGFRAARRQPRQLRLRYRIARSGRERASPLHRGQGPRRRQRPRHHHPQRAAARPQRHGVAPARHRAG
jgi:hypothetical protein